MALFHAGNDVNILMRFHAVAHRPKHRGFVGWIDILVDRHNDLANAGMKRAGGVERAPHFRFIGLFHLNDDQLVGVGQRLVHLDAQDGSNAALVAQVHQH